ncbi:MAG: DUF2461 domain-containing protein [Bacteroidia bacterium]|nr:DUF2461 domain-containing protein [Bacteroidia bacterium]
MAFFTQEYIDFMNELAANNHRDWFLANKKRYENFVKKPFTAFTEEMIKRVAEDDPEVKIEARQAMFRINRDVRFSADKTPYKTSMSAVISRGGRKELVYPGVYFEVKADEARFYGGLYQLEKEDLHQVRTFIMENAAEFERVLQESGFKKAFGTVQGEKNKRLPPEFAAAAEKQPLLYNKGFYYFAVIDPKFITNGKLADKMMELYAAGKPMKQFLARALGV